MKLIKKITCIIIILLLSACGGGGGGGHDDGNVVPIDPGQEIPDFSGKWSGRLTLRSESTCSQEEVNPYYVITVKQSGTHVQVNDGQFVTNGDLYAELDGFYSQASGGRAQCCPIDLWKTSHRLKRQPDGTYNLQVTISRAGQDGDGEWKCVVKYLGAVTRQ